MSYNNTLKANASMFKRSRAVMEEDNRSKRYARGLTRAQAETEESNQLISNKIQQLIKEKRIIKEELSRDYNRDTGVVQAKAFTLRNMKRLSDNQDREIIRNNRKLDNLRSDILTLRRQIETNESEFEKKSFLFFFLKNIFIYLLVAIVVTLLVKNNNINMDQAMKIHIVGVVILVLLCIIHVWRNRGKHPVIFNKQNFHLPRGEKDSKEKKEEKED